MSEQDDMKGEALAIDWQAYEVPEAADGAVAAIVAAAAKGGPPMMAAPRAAGAATGRRGTWLAAGAAALVLAAAAVVLVLMSRGGGDDDRNAEPAVAPDRDERRQQPPDPMKEETWSRRFASPEQRRALQRAIEQARVNRAGGGPSDDVDDRKDGRRIGKPDKMVPGGGGSDKVGVLDKEYIRSVVRDALPLLRECYELALLGQADLAGSLTVTFTIVGEPDVGGLVDAAETSKEGIGANEDLSECVRETMLSLEFPAPEGGGQVEVRYPFVFRPDGEPPPDPAAASQPPEPPFAPPKSTKNPPAKLAKPPVKGPSPKDAPDDAPIPLDDDEDDGAGDDAPMDKPVPMDKPAPTDKPAID